VVSVIVKLSICLQRHTNRNVILALGMDMVKLMWHRLILNTSMIEKTAPCTVSLGYV
jgi:hypothetical protein